MLEHSGSLLGEELSVARYVLTAWLAVTSPVPPKSNMSSLGIAETNFKAGNWPESVSLHRFRRGYPQPDDEEERLCNFGAAAFLLPASVLRRRVKSLQLRLEMLDLLSAELCQDSALTN
jgi:hypothetical protein